MIGQLDTLRLSLEMSRTVVPPSLQGLSAVLSINQKQFERFQSFKYDMLKSLLRTVTLYGYCMKSAVYAKRNAIPPCALDAVCSSHNSPESQFMRR